MLDGDGKFKRELKLCEEFESLQGAFQRGCVEGRSNLLESVRFDLRYWCTGMIGTNIGMIKPTVLILACHGTDGTPNEAAGEVGLGWPGMFISNLGSGFVDDDTLLRNILSSNQEVAPEKRIRLLVLNACESAALAEKFHRGLPEQLLKGIDFVIGHGIDVKDAYAHGFSAELFTNLGRGFSLKTSFSNAQNQSAQRHKLGYQLFGHQLDASKFFLTPGTVASVAEPIKRVLYGVIKADVRAFQPRVAALRKLREWLEGGATPEGDATPMRMLVHALGGFGKTTLAKMFAAQMSTQGLRDVVLFLTLSDGSCVEEYVKVAKTLGAAEGVEKLNEKDLRAHVHGLLASAEWKGKWLVVLDDLPNPRDKSAKWIVEEFPFDSGNTLVTSRWPDWGEEGSSRYWAGLELDGMTLEEACLWVVARVGEGTDVPRRWAGDQEGVRKLVQNLGLLPLAIEQAAAYANQYDTMSPARYLEEQVRLASVLILEYCTQDRFRIKLRVLSIAPRKESQKGGLEAGAQFFRRLRAALLLPS